MTDINFYSRIMPFVKVANLLEFHKIEKVFFLLNKQINIQIFEIFPLFQ